MEPKIPWLSMARRTPRLETAWLQAIVLVVIFLRVAFPSLMPLGLFIPLLFIPVFRQLVAVGRRQSHTPTLPLPGPAQAGGPAMLHLRYLLSASLGVLNPMQLRFVLAQLAGQLVALIRVKGHVPAAGEYRQKVSYTLPLRGQWLVHSGGPTPEASHSWDLVTQRYAYDLLIVDSEGRCHRSVGRCKEDYFCYGAPILAPADGIVVRARDGVRDSPYLGTGWIDWLSRDPRGNFVLIRHAEGEYSFLGHLARGSIRVHEGQPVRRGIEIGRCGHSGHSTEPHVHFHVQDHPNFFLSVGRPVRFDGISVNGGSPLVGCFLQSGTRVEQASLAGPEERHGVVA